MTISDTAKTAVMSNTYKEAYTLWRSVFVVSPRMSCKLLRENVEKRCCQSSEKYKLVSSGGPMTGLISVCFSHAHFTESL